MKKLKLAIFDLTDCEGCELQFLALREKLADVGHDFEIETWRLGTAVNNPGPYDATFIEGSPITESDIEVLKQARKASQTIVTLGTCAYLGGIQSSLPENQREKYLKEIYGAKYKAKTKAPKPVSYYIDVDIHLPGCPVNPKELERLLACLFANKKFIPAYAPVCLDCKVAKNECLFLTDGFCLGPITKGGCGAPCPKAGLRCMGCFGPLKDANLSALGKAAPHLSGKELEQALALFMAKSDEYIGYKLKKEGKK
jgi:sulfhydrogenase subunit delta